MPVRNVSNRGGSIIGQFASIKMKRAVRFESLIEYDFLHLLDFERSVTFFEEQPLSIEYWHNNKLHRYTPDFKVIRDHQPCLVECKPARRVHDEDNQRKFQAALSWSSENGYEFFVVTDEEIRAGYRLKNIKFIRRFAHYLVSPQVKSRIFSALYDGSRIAICVLQEKLPQNPQDTLTAVYQMAFEHLIGIDLDDAPVSEHSLVWFGRE